MSLVTIYHLLPPVTLDVKMLTQARPSDQENSNIVVFHPLMILLDVSLNIICHSHCKSEMQCDLLHYVVLHLTFPRSHCRLL